MSERERERKREREREREVQTVQNTRQEGHTIKLAGLEPSFGRQDGDKHKTEKNKSKP